MDNKRKTIRYELEDEQSYLQVERYNQDQQTASELGLSTMNDETTSIPAQPLAGSYPMPVEMWDESAKVLS